jgi:hypothetical protein
MAYRKGELNKAQINRGWPYKSRCVLIDAGGHSSMRFTASAKAYRSAGAVTSSGAIMSGSTCSALP